jgi:hypothetical protein
MSITGEEGGEKKPEDSTAGTGEDKSKDKHNWFVQDGNGGIWRADLR